MNTLFAPAKEPEEHAGNPMFMAIFREHWENVRHIKNERLTFTNIYGIITAGTLSLMHSVHGMAALEYSLIIFLQIFSVIGFVTSLRLKLELEESLRAIDKMLQDTELAAFMPVDRATGSFTRIPKFRWVFPIFYFVTSMGFSILLAVRLLLR